MTTLRGDLKDKTTLPVFANAYPFIFFEQYVSTLPETVRNLGLAAAAILVVTSLFLVNPLVILLVVLGFVSLIFELLGKKSCLLFNFTFQGDIFFSSKVELLLTPIVCC